MTAQVIAAPSSDDDRRRMPKLSYRQMRVATDSEDDCGLLAMVDGRLVALFTRLDAPFHGEQRGYWHHEFGFGLFDGRPGTFASVADVTRWVLERMGLSEADLDGPVEIG
jgi:hypothetical protein